MLVTNGCSFVWGDELEGYDHEPPAHEHLTFTYQLAEKLGCEYANLSRCGNGNDKIFRDTVAYLSGPNPKPTHMVILWSAWARQEIAENHSEEEAEQLKVQKWDNMTQFSPIRNNYLKTINRDVVTKYFDAINNRTNIIHHLSYMQSMQLLCDSMGIKLIQGVFHRRNWENILQYQKPGYRDRDWGPWMDFVNNQLGSLRPECRVGLGHYRDLFSVGKEDFKIKEFGHPDEGANEEYARLLHHIFGKL